jgi:hypothetical protein
VLEAKRMYSPQVSGLACSLYSWVRTTPYSSKAMGWSSKTAWVSKTRAATGSLLVCERTTENTRTRVCERMTENTRTRVCERMTENTRTRVCERMTENTHAREAKLQAEEHTPCIGKVQSIESVLEMQPTRRESR